MWNYAIRNYVKHFVASVLLIRKKSTTFANRNIENLNKKL